MILASCLMPTANRRRFVPGAIERFRAQDYGNCELVILDDGADAVADLVPDDDRIRYIRAPKFQTLGAKRNAAAAAAQGEVLLHWDDDDWYAPQRVRVQVEALLASGADLCGLDRALFIDPLAEAAWEYVYPKGGAPWVYGATFCYRRAFWQAHQFAGMNIGEDTRFAAAVRPERLCVLADNRFYVALIHAGNTSPKRTRDARWQRREAAALREITGGWPAPVPAAPAARGAVLVAAASGIGDILRVTPLIRALHRLGHAVDVLVAPDNPQTAELLRGAAEIRSLYVVGDIMRGQRPAVPAALAAGRYERAIFSRWAAPLAAQINAREVVHFPPERWAAEGDSACAAAIGRAAGWEGAMPPPFAMASARRFDLPPGTVGLHPGCKPDWPWKRWHGFPELAARLAHVVILGTEADRETAGTYFERAAWPAHARDFTGALSLADSAALISQCAAFVANDSGLMHLAVALGVPTLGVFGITSPAREAMPAANMQVLTKGLDCEPACRRRPWGQRDCARHLACLKTLTAAEVLARLRPLLPAPPAPRAKAVARETLHLAIRMEGGLGDLIVAARLVEAAFHALSHCRIELFYHTPEAARFVFHGTRLIEAFRAERPGPRPGGYDVLLHTPHYAHFEVRDWEKLRRVCPEAEPALRLAAERFAAYRGLFERRPQLDGLWGRISVGQGRNILDNLGYLSGLPINRETPAALCPDVAEYESARALLEGATGYVTFHDGFDNSLAPAPGQATKCWPLAHWRALAERLHEALPGVSIVQLGSVKSRPIPGVDLNLVRRTTLHQAAWILQGALLHVDTDSGLVHLADAVHTRSVAMFGPTDAGVYGYAGNAALRAGGCRDCWWSTPDWLSRCPRGLAAPACMAAITPEQVAGVVMGRLGGMAAARHEVIAAGLYESGLLRRDTAHLRDIFAASGLAQVPITSHASGEDTGVYLHASKQWEYLFAAAAIRAGEGGRRILDAGGGRGALPGYLAALGHEVEVIDRDFLWDHGGDMDIERRYMRAGAARGLRVRYGSVYNLPAATASFDVVTCISVIEHLRHKQLVLRELLRVVRPGGMLVLTFDIAADPGAFEDDLRVEIFSPGRLLAFLAEIGVALAPFAAPDIAGSVAMIQRDGVAGIPPGMTVGGVVLRKLPG